jgi:hypothetical protein
MMAGPFAAARHLRSHAERDEHIKLAKLLNYYLDPGTTFWTSIENRAVSKISGMLQRITGARAGLPDILAPPRPRSWRRSATMPPVVTSLLRARESNRDARCIGLAGAAP